MKILISSIEPSSNGATRCYRCEAFVGNVILKLYEGVGGALIKNQDRAYGTTKDATM